MVASENYVKRNSGLVFWDIVVGKGDCPKAGQQVLHSLAMTYFLEIFVVVENMVYVMEFC